MLKKLLIVVVFGLFFLEVLTFFHSGNKGKFIGFIPEDQKPVYTWFETSPESGSYHCNPKIMVITAKGDTISATFSIIGTGTPFELRYKGTYPPTINKKLYVKVENNDGIYYIRYSSLKPIEK
ncbi:MAG TPA: hypothetical protein VIK86_05030 [Candidatus Paceibacterota bacterium]